MSFAKCILIPTGLAVVGILTATALGVRLNVTPSVPTGLYLQHQVAPNPARGQLVVACLDPAIAAVGQAITRGYLPVGDCPGRIAPVLKPVVAVAGDRIEATPAGITVNGELLRGTVAREADPQGRKLATPAQVYTVPAGSVLLLVNRNASFDGRYFGPVPVSNIRAAARPLLLF